MAWGARLWLGVCALGTGWAVVPSVQAQGQAQAEVLPRTLSLRTSVSADGTAVVTFGGMPAEDCDAAAPTITMYGPDGEVPVQVETVRTCEHLLRPQAALPSGTYCLETDYVGLEPPPARRCFDVTGQVPTPVGASLDLQMREGLRSVGRVEDTCMECESVIGVACTRTRKGWDVVLRIEGVLAELASTNVFASVTATGAQPDTALPAAPEWFALGSDLTWVAILPVPEAGEQACVEVYARPVGTGQPSSVGRACVMGGTAPATLPLAPDPVCGPAFVVRWCADNASDCEGAGGDALNVCQRYAELCEDAGVVASDAADAGDAQRELQTAGAPARASGGGGGCGCRMAPTTSRPTPSGMLLVGLALGAYVRRRRRR